MSGFAEDWQLEVAPTDGPESGAVFRCASPDGEIQVSGTAERTQHGVVITQMGWSTSRPGGITSRAVRKVSTGEIISALRASPHWAPVAESATPQTQCTCRAGLQRPGRAPLTDDLLREVAVIYLEETSPGRERGAVVRMAARFDRPVRTVNNWIARARRDGWLGPASQGRAGSDPGPRLLKEGP